MVAYMEREAAAHGTPWYSIARHMLGLRHGLAGSRRWRQVWSDHRLKGHPAREVMALAQGRVAQELASARDRADGRSSLTDAAPSDTPAFYG